MKRIYLIAPILFLFFSVMSFYTNRNIKINNKIDAFIHIKQFSYEIDLTNKSMFILIQKLNAEINNDIVTNANTNLQKKFANFLITLKNEKDAELDKFVIELEVENKTTQYIYEDIKTDIAVMKHSYAWLSFNYKNYIKESELDKKKLLYIYNILSSKSEYKQVELNNLDVSIHLNRHLHLIQKSKKNIINLHKNLNKASLEKAIQKVIIYSDKKLKKLRNETSNIIKILLGSLFLMFIFAAYIYMREILSFQEMERLKNELQQFVDALNESAIVSKTDLAGRITYVNDKFCEISGYKREELIGENHNVIRHEEMSAEVFKNLWKTIREKKIFKALLKNRKKDGRSYYVESVIVPIMDVNGNIKEYLAVRYDVSEAIKSRDKALMAEKAKGEFLSNMSHELRTPLNAINGFSSILVRLVKDEKHQQYLKNIMQSSDTLIGLINDILDLSKLQSGKFSLNYHDFNFRQKIEVFLGNYSVLLHQSELQFKTNISNSIPVNLNGDWLRISQIFTNLISNAIKFSSKGKNINIDIRYSDGNLIFSVQDYGIGMSKSEQDKIFKPFIQADTSTTRNYGGTGLGLSIVMSLTKQMNGLIILQSKEGEGSKIEITIPLKQVLSEVAQSIDEIELKRENLKGYVLIAEDNKTNQMLISILMDEFGLTYKIVNDGVEAVDVFGKEKFDLVLMDENMPKMNGIDAMRKIHSMHGTSVPIVALTANAMNGDSKKFIDAGMSAYVPKPINDNELYKVIKSLVMRKV